MGLISRVSSRTYRGDAATMFRITRALRSHAYPASNKAAHHGWTPITAPKADISPAIQAGRWIALVVGIWWGNKRWHEIKPLREADHAKQVAAKEALLAKEKAQREQAPSTSRRTLFSS